MVFLPFVPRAPHVSPHVPVGTWSAVLCCHVAEGHWPPGAPGPRTGAQCQQVEPHSARMHCCKSNSKFDFEFSPHVAFEFRMPPLRSGWPTRVPGLVGPTRDTWQRDGTINAEHSLLGTPIPVRLVDTVSFEEEKKMANTGDMAGLFRVVRDCGMEHVVLLGMYFALCMGSHRFTRELDLLFRAVEELRGTLSDSDEAADDGSSTGSSRPSSTEEAD